MSSPEEGHIPEAQRQILLRLAADSIRHGMANGLPLVVRPGDYPPALRARRASFVTLNRQGRLRGCIGHLEAGQSLVEDVAENAWSAAFRDPRFPPLGESELAGLDIHISVLSPPQPLAFGSEQDLLAQIRPGVDGLILEDGLARGTFLPAVWASVPRVDDFWRHLKHKAGLASDHWSDSLKVYRYTAESIP
jgi:AmmeMemoRadiSam system protein A